jgi:hypothetical protein
VIGRGLIITRTRTITTWLATASVWSAFSCVTIGAGPGVVTAYCFDNCGCPWRSGDHRCCASRQWECPGQQPCCDHRNYKPTHDYPLLLNNTGSIGNPSVTFKKKILLRLPTNPISADTPPSATTSKMSEGRGDVKARDRQMASLACTVGNSLLRC